MKKSDAEKAAQVILPWLHAFIRPGSSRPMRFGVGRHTTFEEREHHWRSGIEYYGVGATWEEALAKARSRAVRELCR